MSKRVALTIAAATALALEAHAADMPLKAPPLVAAAPVFNAKSLWAEGEYLYWQTKGDALPALVTGGGTGVLGAPGTSILFGNATVNEDWRSGARLRAGYWFDPNRQSGVEAHFFILGDASADFSASSTGATLIARPFFNTQLNAQDALLVASGGNLGAIGINDTSNILGTGIVYRKELCANCAIGPVSGLIGYRYLRLHDQLDISSFQNVVGIATTFGINDHFETRNEFHGLDLGVTGAIGNGPWNFEWLAKVALGATFTDITVRGATTISVGGVTTVSNGG
ncbi:MAG: BBP7 family outer membrane beta-barrel protein, partial [Xanthobacteraceae bacterium]